MKKFAGFIVAIIVICFFIPLTNAQDNTGNIGQTQNTQTIVQDSVTSQPGSQSTDQQKSETVPTQIQTGTQTQLSQNIGETSSAVRDLSGLSQQPGQDVLSRFNAVAEQQSKDLQQKLGLNEDQTKDIKEGLTDYLKDEWNSRVSLDKEKADPDKVNDINEDLANQRVELSEKIMDNISDQQKSQWQALAVNWWISLDKSTFDIQQNESIMLSRGSGNNNNNNKQ